MSIAAYNDSKFGVGAGAQAYYADDLFAVGGLYKKLKHAHYNLLAAAAKVGVIQIAATHSSGVQSARQVTNLNQMTGDITGSKSTISLTIDEIGLLTNLGFKLGKAKTNSSILMETNELATEVTTNDLPQMIETLTKTYQRGAIVDWTGGSTRDISLVGGIFLRTNQYLDFAIGRQNYTQPAIADKKNFLGSFSYSYMLSQDTKFKLGIQTSTQSKQVTVEYSLRMPTIDSETVL